VSAHNWASQVDHERTRMDAGLINRDERIRDSSMRQSVKVLRFARVLEDVRVLVCGQLGHGRDWLLHNGERAWIVRVSRKSVSSSFDPAE
jgi:hypothetical protein